MVSAAQIEELVNDFLEGTEFYLVDVKVQPGNAINVELDGDGRIGIDECVKVSRHIEGTLDREVEDFSLSVGSAGMGQPLKLKRQYVKNQGREVKVLRKDGAELNGLMTEVNDDGITVLLPASKKKKLPERSESVAWDEIGETKVKVVFK